ncbi:hypothetical protein E4P82_04655 [Candidatus Competibacter phosphatis]|uniref:Uncharacterized protein n=1 Tax=Candidatus Competibacter phosphatis TaxID=221280 RepID=A0ABX1TGP9_9GAMM|nr:hypothetical protein [Candidatus Competibacter phosphatis]NMQ18550.1 hypothetical protein [Candidatus Competibacter phosphatis]
MNTVDDPTLALLSRFVGDTHDLQLSDAEFLLQQVAAIEHYTKQFPAEERQARALEWIETYALQYRRQWRRQAVIDALAQMRCADCPLTGGRRVVAMRHSRPLADSIAALRRRGAFLA